MTSTTGTCIDCGAQFPMALIDQPAAERECPKASERDRLTGQHGHRVTRESYDAWEAAGRPVALAEPRTFTIVREWDVTEAHGAPDAHTYGMCQSAASLAACMGSRVSYTEVDGTRWRMERIQGDDAPGSATWLAMDVTAVAQFDLIAR